MRVDMYVYSYAFFHQAHVNLWTCAGRMCMYMCMLACMQAINWSSISIHVPPARMPSLTKVLAATDAEALRRAASSVRRRLLWTKVYGACQLDEGEGGSADAFDTLMEVLSTCGSTRMCMCMATRSTP